MAELSGRRILVTGGASGIGAAAAKLLSTQGARVAVLDRETTAGPASFVADVTDETAVAAAVDAAAGVLGGLDGLVNCAGISVTAPVETMALDQWRRVIDINLTGTFLVTRAVIPHIRLAGGGTIVTIASASGLLPSSVGSAAYGASKAGVDMFMKYLAKEVAPSIRVNSVCPGMVETPMLAEAMRGIDPAAVQAGVRASYPLQRTAASEEIAEAVLWLTSARSAFVTGISLAVDGGRTFH